MGACQEKDRTDTIMSSLELAQEAADYRKIINCRARNKSLTYLKTKPNAGNFETTKKAILSNVIIIIIIESNAIEVF